MKWTVRDTIISDAVNKMHDKFTWDEISEYLAKVKNLSVSPRYLPDYVSPDSSWGVV